MERTYQRRILVARESDVIAVDLEDNFHRFGIRLDLRGNQVSHVSGIARRVPWATCPGALAALEDLEVTTCAGHSSSTVDRHAISPAGRTCCSRT